mgnify:CR=1 FL=1
MLFEGVIPERDTEPHREIIKTLCISVTPLCKFRLPTIDYFEGDGHVYGLGAVPDAELFVDAAVVSFDRVQGQEQPLSNLAIR